MKTNNKVIGLRSHRRFHPFWLVDYQYKANEQNEFHRDRYPRISIVLYGQLKETRSQQEEWASPMSVVVKPPDALHANHYGPQGTRILSIVSLAENAWPDYLEQPFLSNYHWCHGAQTIGIVSEFLREISRMEQSGDLESALIDLVAGLSRQAGSYEGSPPRWIRQVAEELADRCDESIRIRELAAASDVHPVYLARKFREYFHCNPKQYQFHFRLRRALDDLTQEKQLVEVALDSGYADQSHFTRNFKSATGMSPGGFRRLMAKI